jgi:hypothetical protein
MAETAADAAGTKDIVVLVPGAIGSGHAAGREEGRRHSLRKSWI